MIPILSIVGTSDSGKTTLLEKVVPELKRRGYRVAVVKHDTHGFDIDHEGKDSWRLKQAGADAVVISSPNKIAVIHDVEEDQPLEAIRSRFGLDVDIILTEGFKRERHPKIEVYRKGHRKELICTREDNLVAVASDVAVDAGVPCVDIDDPEAVADVIEEKFLSKEGRKD